jgi:hypothetical protein
MDVYWVTVGGQDPVAYLKKYPDRFKVLHIKDDYVIGKSGTVDFKAIFTQFYKNGYEDWFVEMEGKMTPEQKKQYLAMMEIIKKGMSEGGDNPFGQPPSGQQGGQNRQGAPPAVMQGSGRQEPVPVAEQLKTSLEGIKQSAEYLMKADFVK